MTTMVEKIHGTPVRAGRDTARPGTSSRRIDYTYACWAVTGGIPVKFGTAHGKT